MQTVYDYYDLKLVRLKMIWYELCTVTVAQAGSRRLDGV